MTQTLPFTIAIVGSTATGKTALGVRLAKEFDGEIINCDSVQVYRDIEIATAKPTLEEQQNIPHHLLNFLDPSTPYTAGDWARDAREIILDVTSRGKLPLVVGGTGFYLRALCQPLFESQPTDEFWRARLTRLRARRGAEHLHKLLQRIDPVAAARIAARDWVRTTRALEVYFQTKQKLSDAHRLAQKAKTEPALDIRVSTLNQTANTDDSTSAQPNDEAASICCNLHTFCLLPARAELYERINRRTVRHFERGLIEEVAALLQRGVSPDTTALGAHGYRRALEYLRGERTLESAIQQTQTDVRRYAKRQITWFRREARIHWLEGFGDEPSVQQQAIEGVRALLAQKKAVAESERLASNFSANGNL